MNKTADERPDMALNSLDIVVLTAFAIAQPLFSLLGRSAGFFMVHRSRPIDLLVLVVCVCALPAGALILLEWIVALLKPRALAALHLLVLVLLLALNALQAARRTGLPGFGAVGLAVVAGLVLAIAYARIRTWRQSLVYLAPAVLIFPVVLLFFSPVSSFLLPTRPSKAIYARIGNPVPIVFVVFDEFPLASLVDQDGQIDRKLYPNFAELSRNGTWYRNAGSVGESTLLALPAILSGRYPDPANPRLPDAEAYPQNLFTLLGSGYRLNVAENNTRLCPEPLCTSTPPPASERIGDMLDDAAVLALYAILPGDLTGPLPDITQSWAHFRAPSKDRPTVANWRKFDELTDWHDRPRQFREFTDSIGPSPWPTLHFLHILLPHAPWWYLPSGRRGMLPEDRIRGLRGVNDRGEDPNQWTGDGSAAAQYYQRHLLQVGFVDRLVGSLVKRLRATGLYDNALLIITADHGTSFLPGDSRRAATSTNHTDIMSVPLFIKYPHQQQGGIDDRNAEQVDILPTVVDVLKLQTDWKPEGRSLLADPALERRTKIVVTDKDLKLAFPSDLQGLFASVARRIQLFSGPGGYDVYGLGDHYGWRGRSVPPSLAETGIGCALDHEPYYQDVDPKARVLLTEVTGILVNANGAGSPGQVQVAVAMNGTIGATTQSYSDGGEQRFSALVPESAFRPGKNDIAVFAVRGPTELGRIRRVAPHPYKWGTELGFGANGSATLYLGVGWSTPEDKVTWTDGHRATLYLPTRRPGRDVWITASCSAFVAGRKLKRQRVRVLANGHEVGHFVVKEDFQDYTTLIPKEDFGDSVLELALDLPDAACPIEIGAGTDSRTLGLAVVSLKLELEKGS